MSWPLLALAVVAILIGIYPDPILNLMTTVTGGM
jgi:hypothetical protein